MVRPSAERVLKVVLALTTVAAASGLQIRQGAAPQEVLRTSTDRNALEQAAITLARSGVPGNLALLGDLLRQQEFLARLDDLGNLRTRHLRMVIAALAEHPTPPVVDIFLTLAGDPVFAADGDRESSVLESLAEVKPMSERTALVFRRSNQEGYFAFNAQLLVENGSPGALGLFESMMLDKSEPAEDRVDSIHVCVLPHRTEPAILRVADKILSSTSERKIANGVIESVFDFRQDWFGVESGVSRPPSWRESPAGTLRLAAALADKSLARRDLNSSLRGTVARAKETITQTLTGRHQ